MPKQKSLKTLFKESNGKTAHFDEYLINKSTDKITLDLKIGDTGQASVSDVMIDDKTILSGAEGNIKKLELGSNKSLRGKFLDVIIIITDVATDTDKTSVDFSLNGGPAPYEFFMQKTVLQQGQSVAYKMSIFFTIHAS